MIGLQFHNIVPTKAVIGGPFLSFDKPGCTQPVSITTCANQSASLTGFATAFFTDSEGNDITTTITNVGILTYRWYEVGVGRLTDTTNITGTGTTILTLSNLRTPQDTGRRFYLQADYLSSAGAGGTFVGNAVNDPLNTNTATLTVLPNLSFTVQPLPQTKAESQNATFTVDTATTDPTQTGSFVYQWTLDGQDLEDKIYTIQQQVNQYNQTFTNDASVTLAPDSFDISLTVAGARGGNGGSDAGGPGGGGGAGRVGSFTLSPGGRTLDLRCGDSGSGGGSGNFGALGPGGASSVASGGRGGGAGPGGWSGGGAGGGGASGVYDSNSGGYVIIAGGGGGGGGGSWNRGASPGSNADDWGATSSNIPAGSGGQGQDQGGDGGGGGGGGGGAVTGSTSSPVSFVVSSSQNIIFTVTESSGFFNGLEIVGIRYFPENLGTVTLYVSAGTYAVVPRDSTRSLRVAPGDSRVVQGDDGGGSWDDVVVSASAGSFTSSTIISGSGGSAGSDGSSGGSGGGGGASRYNSNVATLTSGSSSTNSGDGYINLQYKSSTAPGTVVTTSKTRTVSGSKTKTLTINSNAVGLSTIRCVVSRPNSCNSPILSEVVNYNVVSARSIVYFEEIGTSLIKTGDQNLFNGSLTLFGDPGNNMKNIIISPTERDVNVKITLAASAGLSNGSNRGGNGGVTVFEYKLVQGREYNFILGVTGNAGPGGTIGGGVGAFFYDRGKLVICCGGGGGAGSNGRGGDGGGAGIAGEDGSGSYGGSGGARVISGTLAASGFFAGGSYTTQNTTSSTGGRVSSCTIGDSYFSTRFAACADMGSSQFRNASGTIISGTATLLRGFKSGLSHRTNGGNGSSANGGGGGQGTVGGNGAGGLSSGGGGGSGYSSGDAIRIVNSTLGGNTSATGYAIIELA